MEKDPKTMTEATKRPWGYVHHKGLDKHLVGGVLENVAIVEDRHGNAKENADLIVKAVNNHDSLVAACEMVEEAWAGAGDMATAVDSVLLALEQVK